MENKIKVGISAKLIVSIILGFIGIIYVPIGIFSLIASAENDTLIMGLIFTGLGVVLLTVAVILLVLDLRKRRIIKQLVENQQYIWGEVIDVQRNTSIQVNGRNPYVVIVRHQDRRGLLHTFRSRNLYQYPDPSIIGKQVRIYYIDESFKHYYVDVDSVLPNVIEH